MMECIERESVYQVLFSSLLFDSLSVALYWITFCKLSTFIQYLSNCFRFIIKLVRAKLENIQYTMF